MDGRLLRQELDYFHESVRQQLTPYLDNDSKNHTDILLNSLYHVIESELAKFDIKIDMLHLLYKTIATSFLTPLSTWDDDVWGVVDDDGEVMKMQQQKLGTMLVGGRKHSLMKITLILMNPPALPLSSRGMENLQFWDFLVH